MVIDGTEHLSTMSYYPTHIQIGSEAKVLDSVLAEEGWRTLSYYPDYF